MLRHQTRLTAVLTVALVVFPLTAGAQQYFAKINDIRVPPDGRPRVFVTVLSMFGEAPPLEDFEFREVAFGRTNTFTGRSLQARSFKDSGIGTDYILLLPAYRGFGEEYVIAAAEGAGWLQENLLNPEAGDESLVIFYGDGAERHEGLASERMASFRDPEGLASIARPYMLSALDDALLYMEELGPDRRRVLILVGTGHDVRLGDEIEEVVLGAEATPADYNRAYRAAQRRLLAEHQAVLLQYIEALRRANARVYTIGFNETRPDYLEVLRVLSRKTRGTHRDIHNIGALASPAGGAAGGVYGQIKLELEREMVFRPSITLEPGREYEVTVTFRFPDDSHYQLISNIETRPFFYVQRADERLTTNIIPYLIAVAVILVVVFLLIVVLIVVMRKAKGKRKEIQKRKKLQEVIERGEQFCEQCNRKKQPDWDNCLFCASGMEPLPDVPQEIVDGQEAQKTLNEMDQKSEEQLAKEAAAAAAMGTAGAAVHYAQKTGQQLCKTCGRVMMKDWKECMFCAAGMESLPEHVTTEPENLAVPVAFGPTGAPPPGAAAPAGGGGAAAPAGGGGGGEVKTIAIQPGAGVCPACNRPVPADWSECLYCKAGV